ncbi:MAG TPA: hypothetical protein VMH01_09080 [Puia sp.]|nr:hypothetical protein [Puia sp.]
MKSITFGVDGPGGKGVERSITSGVVRQSTADSHKKLVWLSRKGSDRPELQGKEWSSIPDRRGHRRAYRLNSPDAVVEEREAQATPKGTTQSVPTDAHAATSRVSGGWKPAHLNTPVPLRMYINEARERAVSEANNERKKVADGNRPWRAYGTTPRSIEIKMEDDTGIVTKDVWGSEMSFEKLESVRRGEGPALALDVMGQGGFLKYYRGVAAEAAITLVDFRPEELREEELKTGKEVIANDVMNPQTWKDVRKFINKYDITEDPENRGIAVAICKPIAGVRTLFGTEDNSNSADRNSPQGVLPEWMLANFTWNTLRTATTYRPGGTMYFQLSGVGDYNEWTVLLNRTPGIHVVLGINSFGFDYIRISKITRQSPNLPFFKPNILTQIDFGLI